MLFQGALVGLGIWYRFLRNEYKKSHIVFKAAIRREETKTDLIEPLLERAEAYTKTSFELLKLQALDKAADVSATLFSRSLFILIVSFFAILVNIGIALWLGDILGKSYYGFLIVASCYALVGIILLIIHPFIKARVNNAIIRQLFN